MENITPPALAAQAHAWMVVEWTAAAVGVTAADTFLPTAVAP